MSGNPCLRQTDFTVVGAQEINLNRVYISPYMPHCFNKHADADCYYRRQYLVRHYEGWQFFPHLRLWFDHAKQEVHLINPNGATYDFKIAGSKATLLQPYAISNIGDSEMPSGVFDPRNTRISHDKNCITASLPDGSSRYYLLKKGKVYLLDKEMFPNGKILRYHYNDEGQLSRIDSLDPEERYVYASLNLEGTPQKGHCTFSSSTGLKAFYIFDNLLVTGKFRDGSRKMEYNCILPPLLTVVKSPQYHSEISTYTNPHCLLRSFSGKDALFTLNQSPFGEGDNAHMRVDKLLLPVGQNDSFIPVYQMSYQPVIAGKKGGKTTVKNADGTSIIYHFSKNFLTTLIQYFGEDGILKKEKIFSWNDNNWLDFLEIRDGNKHLFHRKSYEYDTFGNPILETFTGDLQGNGNEEHYHIKRKFSQEGRNLLLEEEHENGKVICFSYLGSTNLVTAKLTKDRERILLREFSAYDDAHNLIQFISDDGDREDADDLSHVTQRTITNYILRKQAPFLHMPEWVEEKYLERGYEKLLKRSHLIYDTYGNVAQKEVYDANGHLAYTIHKEYNERGDLLSETNPFEQKATYGYTDRGEQNSKTNFSGRMHITMNYDTKGRLREKQEISDDSISHEILAEYDVHDRLLQETDFFNNSTQYIYDLLSNKISKTHFPQIASVDNKPVSVNTISSYDSLGRELSQTDANGNTTGYRYNAYGSRVGIDYPNGGKELSLYHKDGTLACHTDQDGLTVHYARDVLGRTLSKIYRSSEGKLLAQETFSYSGFNLLKETDKEENVTQYLYDGAGRKIREDIAGHVTDFGYDPLGRVSTICKHNGNNTLFIHYKRDLEGRLLEESKTDADGCLLYKIAYTYDADGNKSTVTRYINGQKSVDAFSYDAFGRLIEHKDPSSFVTTRSYDENYINPLGQRVLQTASIDPLNILTLETRDALNRSVKKEVFNPQKITLSCGEKIYDPHGNLICQKDHVYENGRFVNTQTVRYTHTPIHQVESLTKAYTTSYTHFPSGKTKTKALPNGITLSYEYHPLGFLSSLSSSDGKLCQTFKYNNLGHLQSTCDEQKNITIDRKTDSFGNVTQETFPSGLIVDKEYDDFNRPVSLKMRTVGEVSYKYDPLFLREVNRFSKDKLLYTYHYENYDEDGTLLSEKLIGNLGQVLHKTDMRGQKIAVTSPHFSQTCSYDSVGNLIGEVTNHIEHQYSYDGLSQLTSEKGSHQTSTYAYNSLYNRTNKNATPCKTNDLNQLLSFGEKRYSYDANGNQTVKHTSSQEFRLNYDALNRLIEAISPTQKIAFSYDPLGRRINKIVYMMTSSGWKEIEKEHYLYDGQNEIGAFTANGDLKNLRVLGVEMIGIELEGRVFAPILDVQGNVRQLIDLNSHSIVGRYDFTAFGEELQKTGVRSDNPWRFASKRFDLELGLIYFGKRYYDPEYARWLTEDPAGFVDSLNLYQYVFNNPFLYKDLDGQFAFVIPFLIWGAELALPSLSACVMPIIYGVVTGGVAYGGYKAVQAINKNTKIYAPDRPLPRDKDGNPIPDSDDPHTQLGTKEGSKGKYPQAREFDKDGRPVRDIDFTDHGKPNKHPNPHQHKHEPNETGGTPKRSKNPEPVPEWRY